MRCNPVSGLTKIIIALGGGGTVAASVALAVSSDGGGAFAPTATQVAETTTIVVEVPATGVPEEGRREIMDDKRFDPMQSRNDCPQDWQSYVDPEGRFSLCHPRSINPVTEQPSDPGLGTLLSIGEPVQDPRHPEDIFAITVSWSTRSSFTYAPPSPAECLRSTGTTSAVTRAAFVSSDTGGRTVAGCDWRGTRGSLKSAGEMKLETTFSSDGTVESGFIRIRVDYVGPDLDATVARANEIIDTVRLP